MRILVTGSSGLVGTALAGRLRSNGIEVRPFDLVDGADVVDAGAVAEASRGVDGIVHLAAVSRVVWGERDPARCEATNVGGTANVLRAAADGSARPWVLFASSREVYGHVSELPASEDLPLAPVNVYGRSKEAGEALVLGARARGVRTAVVRLSNVYGRTTDHRDRVVPAFCRAAARGETLSVEGSDQVFDFTHLDDVVGGLAALVAQLSAGNGDLPPIHLVSGQPTSLGELARLAVGDRPSRIAEAPPRTFDVHRFWGDPTRARQLLGWTATTPLAEGVARLVADFAAAGAGR